jgi:hypothetical protein
VGVSFSRDNKLFKGVAMRKAVAVLLSGVLLFSPVSQSLGDSIEIRGNLYDKLGLPKSDGPGDLTLLQGQIGGGITPPAGACGVNAGFSLIAGMKSLQNLGQQLGYFVNNLQEAGTAVALMTLATYFPLAKEALLGANTMSSFLAQLRGFSCSQAMETIKELNYQDSFLIKKCIANKLGISEDDVDTQRSDNFEEWNSAYKSCLQSTSLLDLFGGNEKELNRYLKFISPRSLARCYLGVKNKPTAEELANADLQTKAKYFLYMVLPDITLSAKGALNIQTVQVVETENGKLQIADQQTKNSRPATMMDVMNLHVEQFVEDYKQLIEKLKPVVKFEMGHDSALEASKSYFVEFEEKYGISVEDMAPALILTLRMRDYLQKNVDKGFTYAADLQSIDYYIDEYFMKIFLDKALQRLEMALSEYLIRLKQAEILRKSMGSGNVPGKVEDQDDCFGDSSNGST